VAGSLGNPDSLNRYLYVKDDPVSVVDPSGKYSAAGLLGSCLGAAVGAAVVTILSLAFGIVTIPASLPAGVFVLVTALIACIGGEITYDVVQAIGG